MKTLALLHVVCVTLTGTGISAAEQAAVANEPSAAQLKRVLGFLESQQVKQREATYKACRERGEDFKKPYLRLLQEARHAHAKRLEEVARSQIGERSTAGEALAKWNDWKSVAESAAEFVLTNHQKDKTKFDEMDRQYAAAAKGWGSVLNAQRRLGRAGEEALKVIDDALTALREIHKEMAWCDPEEYDEDEETDLEFFEETLSLQGRFTATIRELADMAEKVKRLAGVHAANDAEKWASPAQKDFARILNDRRAALGLQPLRIEEKLSNACMGHSKEMVAMGYFSHTSPVEENKTFGMRAKNAGFTGAAGGECIFSGSASPASAESGWWYSDGHRLINYSRNPNVLGIGPHGTMWTLNVGNMR